MTKKIAELTDLNGLSDCQIAVVEKAVLFEIADEVSVFKAQFTMPLLDSVRVEEARAMTAKERADFREHLRVHKSGQPLPEEALAILANVRARVRR